MNGLDMNGDMKRLPWLVLLFFVVLSVSGCDFVGDVLEFGLWLVLIVVIVIVLLIYAFYKAFID